MNKINKAGEARAVYIRTKKPAHTTPQTFVQTEIGQS